MNHSNDWTHCVWLYYICTRLFFEMNRAKYDHFDWRNKLIRFRISFFSVFAFYSARIMLCWFTFTNRMVSTSACWINWLSQNDRKLDGFSVCFFLHFMIKVNFMLGFTEYLENVNHYYNSLKLCFLCTAVFSVKEQWHLHTHIFFCH